MEIKEVLDVMRLDWRRDEKGGGNFAGFYPNIEDDVHRKVHVRVWVDRERNLRASLNHTSLPVDQLAGCTTYLEAQMELERQIARSYPQYRDASVED